MGPGTRRSSGRAIVGLPWAAIRVLLLLASATSAFQSCSFAPGPKEIRWKGASLTRVTHWTAPGGVSGLYYATDTEKAGSADIRIGVAVSAKATPSQLDAWIERRQSSPDNVVQFSAGDDPQWTYILATDKGYGYVATRQCADRPDGGALCIQLERREDIDAVCGEVEVGLRIWCYLRDSAARKEESSLDLEFLRRHEFAGL
jgi:hypothetical protein